jgi:hypothetical protein
LGRTVPSFRIALAMEKKEWKLFRDALGKKEKKEFDEMWDIAKLYISACSNSVQLVPLQPIIVSILFHHYKELMGYKKEIEGMLETNVNIDNSVMMMEQEKPQKEEETIPATTLDGFFLIRNQEI